tara:strand:- start:1101 stop:1664 length:564 start_codon:yes stop_codon:yes gene_type:complete
MSFDLESDKKSYNIDFNKKNKIIQFTGEISCESIHELKSYFLDIDNLKKNEERKITLMIQSDGGCLFSAFGMYDWLCEYKELYDVKIETRGHGLIASAATVIFMSGDKRFFGKNSYMLIHSMISVQDEPMPYEVAKQNFRNDKKIMNQLVEFYRSHTKIPKKDLDEFMKKDVFLTYDDVLRYNIVSK